MSLEPIRIEDVLYWHLRNADCFEQLELLKDKCVDHVFDDPPYSEHVHNNSRRGGSKGAPNASPATQDGTLIRPKRGARLAISVERPLEFEPLTDADRKVLARHYARITRRWVGVCCDIEGRQAWQDELEAAGLQYVRTLFWHKVGSTPQMTGDRPSEGMEAIVIAHPKGRKRWNGGGKDNFYSFPIVRGTHPDRMHPTQKPIELMRQIIEDFTDPGDLVLDAHAGSCTTGVACIEKNRRFIGFEQKKLFFDKGYARLQRASRQEILFRVAPTGKQEKLLLDVPGASV
ncbi:MAG TPA: DNA methyltransferase [Thauera aminoaromatica]|nr:DNA methyltransferase [Thauera aminoaromatica]